MSEVSGQKDLFEDPAPEINLVDCPNRETWKNLMWDLNQPGPDGRRRYTVLLHQEGAPGRRSVAPAPGLPTALRTGAQWRSGEFEPLQFRPRPDHPGPRFAVRAAALFEFQGSSLFLSFGPFLRGQY